MNVRFADRAIRCRVTHAELEQLLGGRPVELELALPRERWFRLSVRPGALPGWQFDSDPTGLWLTIPRAALELLSQSLPSRDGLGQEFATAEGPLAISFEVDVRKRADGG